MTTSRANSTNQRALWLSNRTTTTSRWCATSTSHRHRARHARPRDPAITFRVFIQVLLMIILGVIKLARLSYRTHIGGDWTKTRLPQFTCVSIGHGDGGLLLGGRRPKYGGTVLGAHIIALPVALGGIVLGEEGPH